MYYVRPLIKQVSAVCANTPVVVGETNRTLSAHTSE